MMQALKVDPLDNVAVVAQDTRENDLIQIGTDTIVALQDMGVGHKIALVPIGKGQPIYKYGVPIGYAISPIAQGQHVHSHNLTDMPAGE